jgi:hypothetical protein
MVCWDWAGVSVWKELVVVAGAPVAFDDVVVTV